MTLSLQRHVHPRILLRHRTRKVFAAAAVMATLGLAAGCAPTGDIDELPPSAFATDASAAGPDARNYSLGTGDRVKVTVFGHEDLSGEFEIDGSGRIAMPLIQEIEAASRSARDLEEQITDRLDPEYIKNPRVSVEVMDYRPFYILGEVKQPGSYPYVSGMSAWNAIALAGGFTYRAKEDYVTLRRAGDESGAKRKVPLNTAVLPGDVLQVDERFF